MHTYIHTYIHTHRHAYIHTYIYTYMHTYIHTYIYSIHACIHTYVHIYIIHTYIHTHYEYTRIPKRYLCHIAAEEARQKWQAEWTASNKAAATKQYFPSVQNRLGTKLTLTAKLAAVLNGHGKTRAYLNRFNLRDDARCIGGHNGQTMDHLPFYCEKTSTQREVLKRQINQERNWIGIKQELISKHKKVFCEFIDSIDFELLLQNEQQRDQRKHSM